MNFTIKTAAIQNISTSCMILGVYQNKALPEVSAEVNKLTHRALGNIIEAGDISGKIGQSLLIHNPEGVRAKRLLLVGLGKKGELDLKKFIKIINSVAEGLKKYALTDALDTLINLPVKDADTDKSGQLLAQILQNSVYLYTQTKSKKGSKPELKKIDVYLVDKTQRTRLRKSLDTGSAVAEGMALTREMGNLPGNICTPTYLGEQAQLLAKRNKQLKTKVLSEAQMRRLGMGSLLSVGNGSDENSALIIMEYNGTSEKTKPNVIVGKGITFDTGGISLKPGAGMDEMKFDMCGAASVLGTMAALCSLKPKINVVGVIASAENMPSGRATKPGDIVTSMSGQTIEVLNTDAE